MVTAGEPGRLTVASVAGAQRHRTEGLLEALAGQTIAAELEVVVVDVRPRLPELKLPHGLAVTVLSSEAASFEEARTQAIRAARGEIVAFLEDHCHPDPGWAEALASAYRGDWASVGFAIGNANPDRLWARVTYLAEYGEWESPRAGPTVSLPCNNVSYRRDRLLAFDQDLEALMVADYIVHGCLRRDGHTLAIEPAARARHENFERLTDTMKVGFSYSRLLAAERAHVEGWSMGTRLRRSVTILASAPLARMGRLARATARYPRRLFRLFLYSPAVMAVYLVSAMGESVGYLFGRGEDRGRILYWEVDADRRAR
jgi:hypothetical protein